jgi:hypothetical protein
METNNLQLIIRAIRWRGVVRAVLVVCAMCGVAIGIWLYTNKYLTRSKAAEVIANISYLSPTASVGKSNSVSTNLTIATSPNSPISAVDILFSFPSTYITPMGDTPSQFDEVMYKPFTSATDPITRVTTTHAHLMYMAKRSTSMLQPAETIPFTFTVNPSNTAPGEYHVKIMSVVVVGPGNTFTVPSGTFPLDFTIINQSNLTPTPGTVLVNPPTNLSCVSSCGANNVVGFTWNSSSNATGYSIYKDGNAQIYKTVAGNWTSFQDTAASCNGTSHTYQLIAYNSIGSQSTTGPSVQCSCPAVCPTGGPVAPTSAPSLNSADLIFHLSFPDAPSTVTTIPNVRVEIDNGAVLACTANCVQTVTFTRDGALFVSPQMSFDLPNTTASVGYNIVVKQVHTLKRVFHAVYLQRQKVLSCTSNAGDAACGELTAVGSRQMYSGDTDGFTITSPGYNKIDATDLQTVQDAVDAQSPSGDMNFDGIVDLQDVAVVSRNLSHPNGD